MNHGAQAGEATDSTVVVRVPTQESELRAIRIRVATFVTDQGGSNDNVNDLVLAVSELATNVMQHSAADTVTVAMARLANGWQVDVHDADEAPSPAEVRAPADDAITGRGLVIVKALMDDVAILDVGGRTIIRCTKYDT